MARRFTLGEKLNIRGIASGAGPKTGAFSQVGFGPSGFEIDVFPHPLILAQNWERFGLAIRSQREPLKRAITQVMIPSIDEDFHTGGRGQWLALSKTTIDIHGPHDILFLSGKLRRAAIAFDRWRIANDTATFKGLPETAKYGIFHMTGVVWHPWQESHPTFAQVGEFGGGGRKFPLTGKTKLKGEEEKTAIGIYMPARPWLNLYPEQMEQIQEIFVNWMMEEAVKSGVVNR